MIKAIKKKVETLIEKEYLERDSKDRELLHYRSWIKLIIKTISINF